MKSQYQLAKRYGFTDYVLDSKGNGILGLGATFSWTAPALANLMASLSGNINASDVANDSGVSGATVADALDDLQTQVTSLPSNSVLMYNNDATWTHDDGNGGVTTIDLNAAFADLSQASVDLLLSRSDFSLLTPNQAQDILTALNLQSGDVLPILDFSQLSAQQAADILSKFDLTGLSTQQGEDLVNNVAANPAAMAALVAALRASGLIVVSQDAGNLIVEGTDDGAFFDSAALQAAVADPAVVAALDVAGIATDAELAAALANLSSGLAANAAADGDQTADSVPTSPQGTLSFGGTGDAPTGDVVVDIVAQGIADFVDTNPTDPSAVALVDAIGENLDGDDVHSVLMDHLSSDVVDLSAMQALLDTDTDTRVVVSAVDSDADGTDDVLRFEVFAIDPNSGAPTGNALSATDINLISFFDGLGAAGIEYDNSSSGLSGNNVQSAIDELASDVAAMDPAPDSVPVSPNGTISFGGTGDAPTGDIVADATANAIAALIATNPNDPAAVALVNAVGGSLDGEDVHDALVDHYNANPADLAAMKALLDTDTDTRVVPSFIDTDNDGNNDTLRFEIFAVDPASGNTTGSAISFSDISLASLGGASSASAVSYSNSGSGSSATDVQEALDDLYENDKTYYMRSAGVGGNPSFPENQFTTITTWNTPAMGAAYFDGQNYTVPADGLYQFTVGLFLELQSDHNTSFIDLLVDGVGAQRLAQETASPTTRPPSAMIGTALLHLTAGQKVSVTLLQGNTAGAARGLFFNNATGLVNFFTAARVGI